MGSPTSFSGAAYVRWLLRELNPAANSRVSLSTLAVVLGGITTLAQAQDGGAAAAALKILITPPAVTGSSAPAVQAQPGALTASPTGTTIPASPGSAGAAPAAPALSNLPAGMVMVQRGDTLDRIIRRSLGETPFSADFLRKAFVELNPHAFRAGGNPHLVSAGSTLRVPTAAQLQQRMQAYFPPSPALSATGHDSPAHATDAEARKRWVRYP